MTDSVRNAATRDVVAGPAGERRGHEPLDDDGRVGCPVGRHTQSATDVVDEVTETVAGEDQPASIRDRLKPALQTLSHLFARHWPADEMVSTLALPTRDAKRLLRYS